MFEKGQLVKIKDKVWERHFPGIKQKSQPIYEIHPNEDFIMLAWPLHWWRFKDIEQVK